MAVPAHDERDGEFARTFNLPVSDAPLTNEAVGVPETTFRLRDWILSRQRYWGVPIPMVHCDACGWLPVPDAELPVKLPELDDYLPTDDGQSPLAKVASFVRATCPQCKGESRRETDTMDTFVDSSWYFLRYTDSTNTEAFARDEKMKAWLPVSLYVGGSEHNTMHLLYSRFVTKALYDMKLVPVSEPFAARRNHGFVLGPDGQKMSKSKGNVVNPDAEVATHGADAVRMYLAFKGPYEQDGPWDPKGINGVVRFLQRVWDLAHVPLATNGSVAVDRALARATRDLNADIVKLSLNTCVSGLMKLLNALEGTPLSTEQLSHLVRLLAPFAPHMAEELWRGVLGEKASVHQAEWPKVDDKLLVEDMVSIPVQVNGKVRAVLQVSPQASEDEVIALARQQEQVAKYVEQGTVQKTIYIAGKMVNLVVT
jgi:leucyl-tRNA synthetase